MCTVLFAYKIHPKYDLIFLGNRDEFKDRPTAKADFWESHPNILAGIDLEQGGTWAGISKEGSIAFLTNYRDLSKEKNSSLSRGYLTRDFLINAVSPLQYLQEVQLQHTDYNPFNLVVGTLKELWYYSNMENKIKSIEPGLYGLSNALLNTCWFKVEKAKNRLSYLLKTDFSIEDLFDILDDTETPSDEELPQTGVPLETERLLSTIHIDSPTYGTRSKTVILVSTEGEVSFYEKNLDDQGQWSLNTHSFILKT
ncbi:MAG: NRDE family protein [Clostridiaceae bacterium]|nr:NRDE family protein [Clostridiaceae bacterium]